ncbi:LysR substrate-binding domain-containing protein, partial [Vibrio parahaemolyticus]
MLASFHREYPGITISVASGSASEVRRQIEDGAVDLGMLETRRIVSGW